MLSSRLDFLCIGVQVCRGQLCGCCISWLGPWLTGWRVGALWFLLPPRQLLCGHGGFEVIVASAPEGAPRCGDLVGGSFVNGYLVR